MKAIKILLFVCLSLTLTKKNLAQDNSGPKKFHHVLLLQWKDSIDSNIKTEVLKLFQELPSKIKGFDRIDVADLTMSSDKFNTVIIQVFSSEEAYREYEKHPDHLRISKIGPPLLGGFSQFDFWK